MFKKNISSVLVLLVITCSKGDVSCNRTHEYPEPNFMKVSNHLLNTNDKSHWNERNEKEILQKIRSFNKNGKFNGAIVILESLLKESESADLYFEYGIALLNSNRLEEAIVSLNKCALSLFNTDNSSDALFYISVAYSKLGDQKRALQFLQYAIDRGFNDISMIRNNKELGNLYVTPLWKEKEISVLESVIPLKEESFVGVLTDFGTSSMNIIYLCPTKKVVIYVEPTAYDTGRGIYYGFWKIDKDELKFTINLKCFAKGIGLKKETIEGVEEFETYIFDGCKEETNNNVKHGVIKHLNRTELASFLRPYYGKLENDEIGLGLRFRKFQELPNHCDIDYRPNSIEDIIFETEKYRIDDSTI